jgi:hypothetical protein
MELSPEVTAALPVVEALVKCCLGKKTAQLPAAARPAVDCGTR